MTEAEIRQQFRRTLGEGRYPPGFSQVLANRLLERRQADKQRRSRRFSRPLLAIAGAVAVLLVAATVLQLHVHLQNPASAAASPPRIVPPADTALVAPPTFGPGGLVAIDVVDHAGSRRDFGGVFGGASYLYLSSDGGQHWHRSLQLSELSPGTSVPIFGTRVLRLQFFDSRHGVLLTGRGDPYISPRTVLYVTSDGGASWQQRALPTRPGSTPSAAISFIDRSPCFVSPSHGWDVSATDTGVGLYETVDGAQTWTRLVENIGTASGFSPSEFVIGLACSGSQAIAIQGQIFLSSPRVHYSADGGRSWQTIDIPSGAGVGGPPCGVPISFSTNGHGLMTFSDGGPASACSSHPYTSTDGGRTWRGASDPSMSLPLSPDESPDLWGTAGIAANGWWMLTNDQLATSSDGVHWSTKELILPRGYRPLTAAFKTLQTGWIVISDSSNPARHDVILATSDGGSTWYQVKTP